jgi:3-hydroxyisobutyrate dehydrogenase-like beta-hydroxyacid dehydrogenase
MEVGLAGLGRMGTPIARRLLQAGHEVSVWNRSPEKAAPLVEEGASAAAVPAELWAHSDVVITVLADDGALREVALGEDGLLVAPAGANRLLVDMSTVSPAVSAAVAREADGAGVAYLRAPVSGNPSVVEAGNLGIIASGPRDAFDGVERLLGDIGPNVFYLGAGDEARVMKLALNLMVAGTAELMAEALNLGQEHGLDRAAMLEVMGGSAMGSPFVKYKTAPLIADDYSTTFSSEQMYKDLLLALTAGQEVDITLPVTGLVRQLLLECIADGHGDDDFIALVPWLKQYSRRPAPPGAYE